MDGPLRASILAAIAAGGLGSVAQARDYTNLPAEIGRYGPTSSADARVVPGVAGTWSKAATQTTLRDIIFKHARKKVPGCATPQVMMTYTAMPDIITTNPSGMAVAQRAFQLWDVDVCGSKVTYLAQLMWADGQLSGAASPLEDLLAASNLPKYDQPVKFGIENRQQARAVGAWLDLNLPMPAAWNLAAMQPSRAEAPATYEFVPVGQKADTWNEMLTLQVFANADRPSLREMAEGLRQARKVSCGSEQEPAIYGHDGALGPNAPDTDSSALLLLICENIPGTEVAEVTLGKLLAGRDRAYYVHREWRVPKGDSNAVLLSIELKLAEARQFFEQVRLCNPAADPSGCPTPAFF
jgi:hypothetical protein